MLCCALVANLFKALCDASFSGSKAFQSGLHSENLLPSRRTDCFTDNFRPGLCLTPITVPLGTSVGFVC